jgi:N-acetylglucosamine-6-phosphate deacetylase
MAISDIDMAKNAPDVRAGTYLTNTRIFDGEQFLEGHALQIVNGKIARLLAAGDVPENVDQEDLGGQLLVPGFVDVQVNGGAGVMFNDEQSVIALETIVSGHRKYGSTTLMPTFITDKFEAMGAAAEAAKAAIAAGLPGVRGVHFEGPYFSLARRGVHLEEYIRPVDEGAFDLFTQDGLGATIVTLAPEEVPAEFITALDKAGVRVCAGHTSASYDQAMAGFEAGVSGVTHLYNAMAPMMNREPGLIGAAYDRKDIYCGLIVDGIHLHHATTRTVFNNLPTDKVMLVTDAMATVGAKEKSFNLYGTQISVRDGVLENEEGRLAGSDLDMMEAVRITRDEVGMDFAETLRMASLYPATYLGLDDVIGRVAVGYDADFALINEATNKVVRTWIKGEGLDS